MDRGSERHLGNCDLEPKDAREQMRFSSFTLILLSPLQIEGVKTVPRNGPSFNG